jgi:excisionase family DNA binding protein
MSAPFEAFDKREAARRLQISVRTLERLLRANPVGRMVGGRVRFTERDIKQLWRNLPCPSGSKPPAPVTRKTTRYAERTSVAPSTEARALLIEWSRGKNLRG